jgi:MerR family transcriptional regulator, thiopeptide resistance regulator
MPYTVNQLATLAHVSVRTLHHYDAIGLLHPSFIAKNGYRQYEERELIRLQQILFFRELDFSLDDIARIMRSPDFTVIEALKAQQALVKLKRARLDTLIETINTTIKSMTDNTPLVTEELYDAFRDDDVKQYQDEVKERWGNTDAYKQSAARVGKMTKAQMEKLKADGKAFTEELAKTMDYSFDSDEAQAMVQKHYDGVNVFYTCSIAMYRNLGQMYVDDARFTAYYDAFRPGLAAWLRDAINFYCDHAASSRR